MKKMPTLFEREYVNGKLCGCINKVKEGCEWVINGEGKATQKLDGTCCLICDDKIYARYDAKEGKFIPEGAIPCQEKPDTITGHFPHWVLVQDQPLYKYHRAAYDRQKPLENGTYELCGKHIQGDPEKFGEDVLIKHGDIELTGIRRDYEGIREYLSTHNIEGIVFHRENGDMCKIKGTDYGIKRK